MPRPSVKKPALPLHLLKELCIEGVSNAKQGPPNSKRGPSNSAVTSRKERRKLERKAKKTNHAAPPRGTNAPAISKRPELPRENDQSDNDDGLEDEDIDVEMNEEESCGEKSPPPAKMSVPKAVRDKLAEDNAEIAELERRLGIKGRKKLPQSFNDGLGDLLADIDTVFEDEEVQERKKRKAEADEWLASKRRKATATAAAAQDTNNEPEDESDGSDGASEDMDGMDDMEDLEDLNESGFSDEGLDGSGEPSGEESVDHEDDFERFDSEDEAEDTKEPKRLRENPYVAPVTGKPTAKYVPPSLRKETGSDAELAARVRRQTQGLVNRVTDANLVTIVGEIEKLYRENPRQHVSSALVDLLLIQICEPTALPDTLLILNAGFATAVYKVIGMDFGAQLIQELVERFARYHDSAKEAAVNRPDVSKETSNLITFLAQLYNLQLIGPKMLFDYIRLLLSDLSELNAELLLRIVRMSGRALRHDDPLVLKDIVALIQPSVSKIGEQNLSVRTKFMIETIQNLKNNKMKAGTGASAIVLEHVTRMKKTLGALKSRKLKSTEPLRIGLKDLQESDKKGKWWLVGASWAGSTGEKKRHEQETEEQESEDDWLPDDLMDTGPDVEELARQQMMNTDVRRSIFVAITLACDYEDAYARINKLRLSKHRKTEIPFVLMQCVGAEQHYNPYYTLVAQKLCSDHKIKWSFQNSLWKFFKRLGESIFGEDTDDVDDGEDIPPRRLVNNAKMFGTLVAEGTLSLGILKCLNLPYLQAKTKDFVHVMLIIIFQECLAKKDSETEAAIANVFKAVKGTPDLARGLQWFLRKVIRKTDLAGGKSETKRIKEAGKMAEAIVEAVLVEDHGLGE